MNSLAKVLLVAAVILYGLSLVLPNRIFDLNVEANPKYAPCFTLLTPGVVCAPVVEGLKMQCWSPRSMNPDYAIMEARDIENYCGTDWDEPVTLVEDGFSNTGILGGGISLIIGAIGALAVAFTWGRHDAVSLLIAGFAVVLVFTFDNSKKVMDASGTHLLTGGHSTTGFYVLEAATVALFVHILLVLIASRGKNL